MFLQLSVILFTGGGSASVHAGIPPLTPGQTPPLEQAPPVSRHPSCAVHAGRYGQQAGGMHPTGMQSSCIFEKRHSDELAWEIMDPLLFTAILQSNLLNIESWFFEDHLRDFSARGAVMVALN